MYITINLMGGLGNQLFQSAVVLALAKKHNKIPIFPPMTDQRCSRKISYNQSYLHKLQKAHVGNIPLFIEKGFSYKPIQIYENTRLIGYFQSEKYFIEYKEYILDSLCLPDIMVNVIREKYQNIIQKTNTVSIHVRRGDYVQLQQFHCVQDIDYYEKALQYFNKNENYFVIFSDDIDWCKELSLFQNLPNKCFIQDVDYHELYLMSQCKHNIIANSTFSWWGAYMNPNNEKIVVAPQKWFGPQGHKDTYDVIPDSWIIIKNNEYTNE